MSTGSIASVGTPNSASSIATRRLPEHALAVALAIVVCVVCAGTAFGVLAPSAHAATAGTPYYHFDTLGRRWIYAHAHQAGCASSTERVEGIMYQYWDGAPHVVSQDTKNAACEPDVLLYVYCGAPYTPYTFRVQARGWWWTSNGWSYLGNDISQAVMYC